MKILKTLTIIAMLASPFTAFALGGNDPTPGIDIIIKREGIAAKNVRFNKADLKAINKLKGLEKPNLIAKIAAQKLTKANPKLKVKGGWHNVLKKGILKSWCVKCNGGTTKIEARIDGEDRLTENCSIYVKIPKSTKPTITKMKAQAATKAMVKKK